MNELTETKATMTVYEVRELCEYKSPHKNAMKICETLMTKSDFMGAETTLSLKSITYGDNDQKLESYVLNKNQSISLAGRLNCSRTMKVVERWEELEASQAVPSSPPALGVETMTSLEIAELTDKRHGNVIIDIEKTLDELEIAQLKFQSCYLDSNSRERKMYSLPRYECDIVIAGYSTRYRAAIVKRWHELEEKEVKDLSPSEMFLQSAQLMVNLEKGQLEIKEGQLQTNRRVDIVDKKVLAIDKNVDTVDKKFDTVIKRIDEIKEVVGEKASRDKHPEPGYFSIAALQFKFASKFPKYHTKGLLYDPRTRSKIRSCACSRYVPEGNTISEYTAYNFDDMISVIKHLIKTGARVKGTGDVKSRDYRSAFKHPMN